MKREEITALVSGLVLPADVGVLVADPRWTPESFVLLCDVVEGLVFTRPASGLEIGRALPPLADRLGDSHLKSLGYIYLGAGLRAMGKHEEAGLALSVGGLLSGGGPLPLQAEWWFHRAMLDLNHRDFDAAKLAAESGYRVAERSGVAHHVGRAALYLGNVAWYREAFGDSLRFFAECLEKLHVSDDQSRRYHFCASGNLGLALEGDAVSDDDVRVALGHLTAAREQGSQQFEDGSMPLVKLGWSRSRCLERLDDERAVTGYRETVAGLRALSTPFELALASLDLAAVLFQRAEYVEVASIARQVWPVFSSLKLARDGEAYAAMLLFYRSAVALGLTAKVIDDARVALRAHERAQA